MQSIDGTSGEGCRNPLSRFADPNEDYFTSCIDKEKNIEGQPVHPNHCHRPIQEMFQSIIFLGFCLNGFL